MAKYKALYEIYATSTIEADNSEQAEDQALMDLEHKEFDIKGHTVEIKHIAD